jgi:hypothetical protein
MTRGTIAIAGALVLAACKGGPDKPATAGSGSSAPAAAAAAAGSGSAAAAAAAGSTAGAGAGSATTAAAAAPALSPKIKAARCGEPCLFLTDTPLAQLLDSYKAECGGMTTKDLGYEDCKSLDYARNCIYAAHGLVFKKKKWKVFATKPWYEARPEFKAKAISPLEVANVSELNKRGKACKAGVNISGADFERLKQWAAATNAGKLPAPKVIFIDNERKTAAELVAWLKEELSSAQQDRKLSLQSEASGSYEPWDQVPAELVQAIKAPAGAKLRSILVDVNDPSVSGSEDNPVTEGMTLRFVYDDKDQLLAVGAAHYLYD